MPQKINSSLFTFNDRTTVHCIVAQFGEDHREHAIHEFAQTFYYTLAVGSTEEPNFPEEEAFETLHQAYTYLLSRLSIPL